MIKYIGQSFYQILIGTLSSLLFVFEIPKILFNKKAITEYKVLDKVGSHVALVALYPKTGRTHQLRVHLEHINAPIVGDVKYKGLSEVYFSSKKLPGHKKISKIKWEPNNIKNLQLHAYSIKIPESEIITAEVSEDFKQNLKFLGLKLPKKLHNIFI